MPRAPVEVRDAGELLTYLGGLGEEPGFVVFDQHPILLVPKGLLDVASDDEKRIRLALNVYEFKRETGMDVEHCVLAAAPSASFFQLLTSWGMRCHTAVLGGGVDAERQLSQFLPCDDAQGDLFPPVLNLFTARLVEHMGSTPLSPRLAGVLQDLGRRKDQHKRVLPRALQWSADADPHFLLSHNLAMVQKHPKEHIIVALRDALNTIDEQRVPCALSLMAALVVLQFGERKARIRFAEVSPVAKDVARALEEHESSLSSPFRELLEEVAKKLEGASRGWYAPLLLAACLHQKGASHVMFAPRRAPSEDAARESPKIYEFALEFLRPGGIMDKELAAMKGLTAKLRENIGGNMFSELHTHLTGMGGPGFWIGRVMKDYLPRRLAALGSRWELKTYDQVSEFVRKLTGLDEERIKKIWDDPMEKIKQQAIELLDKICEILVNKKTKLQRPDHRGKKPDMMFHSKITVLAHLFYSHCSRRGLPGIGFDTSSTEKFMQAFMKEVSSFFEKTGAGPEQQDLVAKLKGYVEELRKPPERKVAEPFSVDPVISVDLLAKGLGLTCPRELTQELEGRITMLEEKIQEEVARAAEDRIIAAQAFQGILNTQVVHDLTNPLKQAKDELKELRTRHLAGQIVRNLATTDFDSFQGKFRHYTVFNQREREFQRVFGIRNIDLVAEIWPEAIHELEGIYGGIYYLPDPLPTHSVRPAVQQRVEALMKNCFAMLAVDGGRPQETDMLMYRSRFTPEFYPRRFALKDALYEQSLEVLTLHVATLARHLAEAGVRYTEISHSVKDISGHVFNFIKAGVVYSRGGKAAMERLFQTLQPGSGIGRLTGELVKLFGLSPGMSDPPGVDIRFLAGFPRTRYDYTAFLTNHSRSPLKDLFQDPRRIMKLARLNAKHPLGPGISPEMVMHLMEGGCRALYRATLEGVLEYLRLILENIFLSSVEKLKQKLTSFNKERLAALLSELKALGAPEVSPNALAHELREQLGTSFSARELHEYISLVELRADKFYPTFRNAMFPELCRAWRRCFSGRRFAPKEEIMETSVGRFIGIAEKFLETNHKKMFRKNSIPETFWMRRAYQALGEVVNRVFPPLSGKDGETPNAFEKRKEKYHEGKRTLFGNFEMQVVLCCPRLKKGFEDAEIFVRGLNKEKIQAAAETLFASKMFEEFSRSISKLLLSIGRAPQDLVAKQLAELDERILADPGLVVGLDWMSDEVYNPFCALVHPDVITFAQRHGLGIRIHDGELAPSGPELEGGRDLAEFAHMYVAAKSIVHTFRELDKDCRGASWRVRIGHGIAFANWTWDGGQAQTFLEKLKGFGKCEIHKFADSEQMFLDNGGEPLFRWGRFAKVDNHPEAPAQFQIARVGNTKEFRVSALGSIAPSLNPLAAFAAQSEEGMFIKYCEKHFKFAKKQKFDSEDKFYAQRLLELVENVEVIRRHICLEVNLTSNFFLVPNFAVGPCAPGAPPAPSPSSPLGPPRSPASPAQRLPPAGLSQHALRRLLYLDFRCTLSTDNDGIWEIAHGGHVGVAAEYALAIENRMFRTEEELEALRGAADECRFWPLGYKPAVWEKLRVWELGEPEELEGFTIRSSRTELLGLPDASMRIWSCALSSDGFLCAVLEGDSPRLVVCDEIKERFAIFQGEDLQWACVYGRTLFFGLYTSQTVFAQRLHDAEWLDRDRFSRGASDTDAAPLPRGWEAFKLPAAGPEVCLDLARHGWLVGRAEGKAFAVSLTPHETLDEFPPVLTERRHRLLWERLWAITTMCFPTDTTELVPSGLAPHAEYAPRHIEMLINALLNGRARLGGTPVLTNTLNMDLDPPSDVDPCDSCWILIGGALFLGSRDGRNWRLFDVRPKK